MAEIEQAQRKRTMLRDEKMLELEDDNGLWTVKCLRGRLLAERAASKAAKDNVELLEKKLIELQEKLQLEIKLKSKAEKRLKFLMKKLESLKLSPDSGSLSSSSVKSEQGCYSNSSMASSVTAESEEKPVITPLEDFAKHNGDIQEDDCWINSDKTLDRPSELRKVGDTKVRYNTSLNRECVKHYGAIEPLRNTVKQQCC